MLAIIGKLRAVQKEGVVVGVDDQQMLGEVADRLQRELQLVL